ncbi:PhoD-like phosphatase-domain-containing protein [Mucidula mucida]|nr:PhoD-like phosphatase-domain-containing protein [Mucidula mucida]
MAPLHDERVLNFILSLPTSSKRVRWATTISNCLLLAAVAELIITPFVDPASNVVFTHIGAVTPDTVKITARLPPTYILDDVHIVWREHTGATDKELAWKHGPELTVKENNDWVDVATLKGLWPNTYYEYSLAAANGTLLSYPEKPIKFHTFPDPRLPGNKFSFMVTSCSTPNFPYLPFHGRRIKGYDYMSAALFPDASNTEVDHNETDPVAIKRVSHNPEFLLFLGDFIYADVPFWTGPTTEDYRRLYRRNYQSESFRKIYERLPIYHAYDDHEFINDFSGDSDDLKAPFMNASSAFKTYNADNNYDSVHDGHYYYDFRYGDSAFFVMDTRRYRTSSTEDMSSRVLLGDAQLAAFNNWLSRVNETAVFKFVVSSVPFTTLWSANAPIDAWAGFPTERQSILEALHSVPNVVILTGDRHEFAAIEYNHETLNTVTEFSTSPLSMFDVPFIRTLTMQGKEMVKRVKMVLNATEDGPEYIAVEEKIPAERVLKYVPLEVDTKDSQNPTLNLKLSVNGQTAYTYSITGKPVKLSSSTALGVFVSAGIKDVFDKIGIHPSKWF